MQRVPVLMYHSVGLVNSDWHWNYLTCPYQAFEDHLQWLKQHRFQSIHLDRLHGYINHKEKIPDRSIVLTFDDGYLDNWIFAYPLLKKYGFSATVFVNPEFVDPRSILRPRLDELDNPEKAEKSGYLSWDEMQVMEKEGTIDIQSHGMSHTHYPVSCIIKDFRHPGDACIRLSWNANKDQKPWLQTDNETATQLGEPIYEMKPALASPRFFPDSRLTDTLVEFVIAHGGHEFFKHPYWRNRLFAVVYSHRRYHPDNSRMESEFEFSQRVTDELSFSKKEIASRLGKRVDFFCWPEGSGTAVGVKIAGSLGYKMSTAAKDIPLLRKRITNSPQMKINRIHRFSPVLSWNGIEGFQSKIRYMTGMELGLKILAFKNHLLSRYWANGLLWLIRLLKP